MYTEQIVKIAESLLDVKQEYEISTGLLTKQHDNYVFVVQNPERWRRIGDDKWEAGLVGIGGKLEEGETIIQCLRRESVEELASDVYIEDSDITYLVTEKEIKCVNLSSSEVAPRPYFITLARKTEIGRKPFTIVFSYKGVLLEEPRPMDVSALVFAHDSVLVQLLDGPKTVKFLREHSARFVERVALPDNLYLRPYGTLLTYLRLMEYSRKEDKEQ